MSKPVSNSDVEGVVSSIRRLVSDTEGHDRNGGPPGSERLVLSAEQRVSDTGILRLQSTDAVQAPPEDQNTAAAPSADATPGAAISAPPGATTSTRSQKRGDLTAKIAALETAIARTADQWEPDGASKDDYAGKQSRSMSWSDAAELDATGKPVETPGGGADATTSSPAPSTDDHVIDEAALSDLVADIVRAELRGDVGAQITRTVRTLVRREIHRALAARELE